MEMCPLKEVRGFKNESKLKQITQIGYEISKFLKQVTWNKSGTKQTLKIFICFVLHIPSFQVLPPYTFYTLYMPDQDKMTDENKKKLAESHLQWKR